MENQFSSGPTEPRPTRDATSCEPSKTRLKSSIQSRRKNARPNDLGYSGVFDKNRLLLSAKVDYIAWKRVKIEIRTACIFETYILIIHLNYA